MPLTTYKIHSTYPLNGQSDCIHLHLNTTYIKNIVIKRRLRYFGNILRRPQEFTHISLLAKPSDRQRQKRGEPTKTWNDTVREDFECISDLAIYGLRLALEGFLPAPIVERIKLTMERAIRRKTKTLKKYYWALMQVFAVSYQMAAYMISFQ